MARALAGTRIRELRKRKNISQTALATQVGISASYLNLIEHNKRRIAGRVLNALARALAVPVETLAEQVDGVVHQELFEAAAASVDSDAEIDAVSEFVGRFPGWADVILHLQRRVNVQQEIITTLSDRLTHDPFLSESLHQMLSNITAIRSTSSILTSEDDIPEHTLKRFHQAVHEESIRLSGAAQSLSEYFDRSAEKQVVAATPEEELDGFLVENNFSFETFFKNHPSKSEVSDLLKSASAIRTDAAKSLAETHLHQYRADIHRMPSGSFLREARKNGFNLPMLTTTFNVSLTDVFRRFAQLSRDQSDLPQAGVLTVNAAGHALNRIPLEGFPMPRHGNACALWPVFKAFSEPGRPHAHLVEMPDGNRFVTLAISQPRDTHSIGKRSDFLSTMFVISQDTAQNFSDWLHIPTEVEPIGTSCRICARKDCQARAEPGVYVSSSR